MEHDYFFADATLTYHRANPYAAHLAINGPDPHGEPMHFTFARELLHDGLEAPTPEEANVCFWPLERFSKDPGDLAMRLRTPDRREFRAKASHQDVVRFLKKTYKIVKKGKEGDNLNMDHIIAQLLRPRQ